MTKLSDNYSCDGQMSIFDYEVKNRTHDIENSENGTNNTVADTKYTSKNCSATLEPCDCHCGVDSCCQYCANECEYRCNYSINQPQIFDRVKGKNDGWIDNPNCTVLYEMFKRAILRGSGFRDGKKRIIEMYRKDMDKRSRADAIKKEYGSGGWGSPLIGFGLHGADASPKRFKIVYRDMQGEHETNFTWETVEQEIGKLIKNGEYQA